MIELVDRSELVSARSEADVETQYYRAMAAVGTSFRSLLDRLAETVAEAMYDFCIVHVVPEDGGELETAAFHHADPRGMEALSRLIEKDLECVAGEMLEEVAATGESLFFPDGTDAEHRDLEFEADGGHLAVNSLIVVPMTTARGVVLGAMAVGRDATTRPYEEADLRLAESMGAHAAMKAETILLARNLQLANAELEEAIEVRDTFISIASHELRTPLGAMQLMVQLLQREAKASPDGAVPAEKVTSRLDGVQRQIDRMSSLVARLLDVSRLSDGGVDLEVERVDLRELVGEVVERTGEESADEEVEISVTGPDEIVGEWDPDRVDQIVTNLVSNAVKYGGGSVEVTLEAAGEEACICVKDDGPGIAAEDRQRVFQRFERCHTDSHGDGLGLGLWIIRELVDQMGGRVELTSEPGEGAAFTVGLPRAAQTEPAGES